MKFKIFISSVQSEFAEARTRLVAYIREDALLGRDELPRLAVRSKSRNLTIAQALNWAGYVEQSGNGTESIIQRCKELGLSSPQYFPDNCDFKTIIWRRGYGAPVVAPVVAPTRARDGFVDLPAGKMGDILAWLWDEPLKKGDIALRMGIVKKARSLKLAIDTLLSDNLIEYTIPEKPDHKQQRYQLSEKGREMLKSHLRLVQ